MGENVSNNPEKQAVKNCSHQDMIREVTPTAKGCQECLKTGDRWVHLRFCKTCGFVGCCDQSKNRHARRHFEETAHPVIQSLQPGETWMWCFADEVFVKSDV